MKGEGGYTLVEMLIVISIIAIIALLALINFFPGFDGWRLNGAARTVASDLNLVKMMAISRNESVRMSYMSNQRYVVELTNGTDLLPERNLNNDYTGVTLTNFNNVTFNSRGLANNNTITITNSVGSTRDVVVLRTGRVRIN